MRRCRAASAHLENDQSDIGPLGPQSSATDLNLRRPQQTRTSFVCRDWTCMQTLESSLRVGESCSQYSHLQHDTMCTADVFCVHTRLPLRNVLTAYQGWLLVRRAFNCASTAWAADISRLGITCAAAHDGECCQAHAAPVFGLFAVGSRLTPARRQPQKQAVANIAPADCQRSEGSLSRALLQHEVWPLIALPVAQARLHDMQLRFLMCHSISDAVTLTLRACCAAGNEVNWRAGKGSERRLHARRLVFTCLYRT